ncbi:RNA ligase [Halalkaliarchaeum desulfuricum]|nr:RNA ligase [Halalkaliarchaeum desulfuricum]
MNEQAFYERLDSTAVDPPDLFEHFEEHSAGDRTYYLLPDARHEVERGTVVLPDADAVVRGYPSVPRVFVLDPGIPSFFGADARVSVEEKLNGFNVRIAAVGGVLAFTRSGYVCPYTTDRARALLDPAEFFEAYPGAMLCAELIGPETPYTAHDYDDVDSHAVRVFGIRDRETGEPFPVDERRELCERYGFPQPTEFGRGTVDEAVSTAKEAIAELDAAGREGIVVKSEDGREIVKYTTASQTQADLAYAFELPFDYGRDFVFSRVIREGFRAVEFDEDGDRLRERAHDLGESILLPMVETIHTVAAGDRVGERQTVRGDPRAIDELLSHLEGQGLTIEIESDQRDGDQRVVEFLKVSQSTSDRIDYYLDGGTYDE